MVMPALIGGFGIIILQKKFFNKSKYKNFNRNLGIIKNSLCNKSYFLYNKKLSIRNFSSTGFKLHPPIVRYSSRKLDRHEKTRLRNSVNELQESNPTPVVCKQHTDQINSEKPLNLAAAFLNDIEGLEKRQVQVKTNFEKNILEKLAGYYAGIHSRAKEIENMRRFQEGKGPLNDNTVDDYLSYERRSDDKMCTAQLPERDKHLGFLSTKAYNLLKKSENTHNKALEHLKNKDPSYIIAHGKPDKINKNFFEQTALTLDHQGGNGVASAASVSDLASTSATGEVPAPVSSTNNYSTPNPTTSNSTSNPTASNSSGNNPFSGNSSSSNLSSFLNNSSRQSGTKRTFEEEESSRKKASLSHILNPDKPDSSSSNLKINKETFNNNFQNSDSLGKNSQNKIIKGITLFDEEPSGGLIFEESKPSFS